MALPIDGIDGINDSASVVREGLVELEVLNLCGECMLRLKVADSMLGRDLMKMILDNVPVKPGHELVVSHNTATLVLHESLQQQGLGGAEEQVWATYIPTNLSAALRFAHGHKVADDEFSLNGITEVTGVDDETPALLQNLPNSLCTLTIGNIGISEGLHHVRLPAHLQSLTLSHDFNHSLDNVTWPAGLQSLTFGHNFNQSLDNVTWPAGLQSLTLGTHFNQSLDNVTWPAGLQSVTFGAHFNQSVDNVSWPAGLQSLTFGWGFDQNLDQVTWPAGLQRLVFGLCFDQNLDNLTWPAGLQSLTFGGKCNQNLDNVTWPAGLQNLTLVFISIRGWTM